jgi:hypothetical protein
MQPNTRPLHPGADGPEAAPADSERRVAAGRSRDLIRARELAQVAYDHGQSAADLGAFLSRHADLGLDVSQELRTAALAGLAALRGRAS